MIVTEGHDRVSSYYNFDPSNSSVGVNSGCETGHLNYRPVCSTTDQMTHEGIAKSNGLSTLTSHGYYTCEDACEVWFCVDILNWRVWRRISSSRELALNISEKSPLNKPFYFQCLIFIIYESPYNSVETLKFVTADSLYPPGSTRTEITSFIALTEFRTFFL